MALFSLNKKPDTLTVNKIKHLIFIFVVFSFGASLIYERNQTERQEVIPKEPKHSEMSAEENTVNTEVSVE